MTVAAIYARFSSDSQRDESIEIQVDRCSQLIGREGWAQGEVYADFAMTGTNDERPAFKRCVADGVAGAYDVLVIYKHDRFARNVEVSRRYKRQLRDAGIRIVSVREGESKDTPDGFLHEGLDELFAEYYSRNLSVLIRDGISKNAASCKASGRRVFGYRADEEDRYIIDEAESALVREFFGRYVGGETVVEIERWAAERGARTARGNAFSRHAIAKILKNDAYAGVYRYAGVTVEGGMPAVVPKEVYDMAQEIMRERQRGRRRGNPGEYLLSGKLRCLRCGGPMSGVSGTGKNGRKYTYYGCVSKSGNCGLRVPAGKVEDAVVEGVKDMLSDSGTMDAMVESVLCYAASLPNMEEAYASERQDVLRRRGKLVDSIAEGVPASAVRDAIVECEERLGELDMLIARERFNREKLVDESEVRSFLAKFIDRADRDADRARLLVDIFIDEIYIDEGRAAVVFTVGDGTDEVPYGEVKALVNGEHPLSRSSEGVRMGMLWWSAVTPTRNLYRWGTAFALLVSMSSDSSSIRSSADPSAAARTWKRGS